MEAFKVSTTAEEPNANLHMVTLFYKGIMTTDEQQATERMQNALRLAFIKLMQTGGFNSTNGLAQYDMTAYTQILTAIRSFGPGVLSTSCLGRTLAKAVSWNWFAKTPAMRITGVARFGGSWTRCMSSAQVWMASTMWTFQCLTAPSTTPTILSRRHSVKIMYALNFYSGKIVKVRVEKSSAKSVWVERGYEFVRREPRLTSHTGFYETFHEAQKAGKDKFEKEIAFLAERLNKESFRLTCLANLEEEYVGMPQEVFEKFDAREFKL